MEERIKYGVIGALCIAVVFAGHNLGVALHNNDYQHNRQNIAAIEKSISDIKRDTKQLSLADFKQADAKKVDIGAAKQDLSTTLTDLVNQTYTAKINAPEDEHEALKLPDQVDAIGKKYGKDLATSWTGVMGNFMITHDNQLADEIKAVKVGFGKYDEIKQTLPVTIYVVYTNDGAQYADNWRMVYHADTKKITNSAVDRMKAI